MIVTILAMTICVAKPNTFKCGGAERDISVMLDITPHECETRAQALLPQILAQFPNNVVTRYKCVADNGRQKLDI